MAKFLEGNELNLAIENIFLGAEEQLILISPYIKFHSRDLDALRDKQNKPKIKLIVVFGKNENDISKSIGIDDIDFLKQFPNIEIRYESRLHAKYYNNENAAILTSMNLLDYSQNNNIEVGILMKSTLFSTITNIFEDIPDFRAATYFNKVIENAQLLFKRVPQYDTLMLGLTKKYKGSIIKQDILNEYFTKTKYAFSVKEKKKTEIFTHKKIEYGFCIRTGAKIPFNIKRPMSDEAFSSWVKFKNENYPEKYCHFSGENSLGKTSYARPILEKNLGDINF